MSIDSVTPLDLVRLARAEFKRFDVFADGGAYEMFASARMAQQLIAEAADRLEQQPDQL